MNKTQQASSQNQQRHSKATNPPQYTGQKANTGRVNNQSTAMNNAIDELIIDIKDCNTQKPRGSANNPQITPIVKNSGQIQIED